MARESRKSIERDILDVASESDWTFDDILKKSILPYLTYEQVKKIRDKHFLLEDEDY